MEDISRNFLEVVLKFYKYPEFKPIEPKGNGRTKYFVITIYNDIEMWYYMKGERWINSKGFRLDEVPKRWAIVPKL